MRAGELSKRLLGRLGVTISDAHGHGFKVARVTRAEALAPEWDALCESLFQRRAFLGYLEQRNPRQQRYYELRDAEDTLVAGAVVCTIEIDLLTYSRVRSPVRLAMLCVPCDQSAPGLVGEPAAQRALASRLLLEEPRFLVGLNLDTSLDLAPCVEGRNLPGVVLRQRFDSFEDYVRALRAPYRRRLKRISAGFTDVDATQSGCDLYGREHHALYLDVYRRSDAKLAELPFGFFCHLPEPFVLTTYRRAGRLLGWHITVEDRGRFTFLLEGHVGEPGVYFNLLLGVLRLGIEAGAELIDFGQTAEVPKMRLGGELQEKVMFASHPHLALRTLIQLGRPLLTYRRRVPEVNVFR